VSALTGLTNRDIAFLVWLSVVVVFLAWKRDTRESLMAVARAFWGKVAVLFLCYVVYIALVVALAYTVDAWNTGLLKETVAWFLVPGIVLLFGFSKAYEGRAFYLRTLLRVIGLTAVIEFYVNLTSFPLWFELVLLPLTVFLVALSTVAGLKPDTEIAKRWVDRVIAVVGLVVLVATGIYLANDWANLDKTEMALSFAQPIWLTLASLPFIFVFSLFAGYEEQFVRIGFFSKDDPKARRRAKLALGQELPPAEP
jgi:peptidoglycan/LPS O-acetylase OafA/YrhL